MFNRTRYMQKYNRLHRKEHSAYEVARRRRLGLTGNRLPRPVRLYGRQVEILQVRVIPNPLRILGRKINGKN